MDRFCNNCLGGCIHRKLKILKKKVEYRDSTDTVYMVEWKNDGSQFTCDKNPEGFEKWHKEHSRDTYDTYKDYPMDCYEGSAHTNDVRELIELSSNILSELQKMKGGDDEKKTNQEMV